MSQETVLTALAGMPNDEALLRIAALEKRRYKESYIKYWKPYPKQSDIFPQFTEDIKLIGLLGGNRSGKTEVGAFISLAFALGKQYFKDEPSWEYVKDLPIPEPPNNIWIVGLDHNLLGDVIWSEKLLVGREHPPLLPTDKKIVVKVSDNDYEHKVEFANGSVITGKSAESGAKKFQAANVDLVWIDEECEKDVYDECYQRTVSCGGKILLTLTPLVDINSGLRDPWVYDLYEESKTRSYYKFLTLSALDNPYIPAIEKERLIEKWAGHAEERARLYGEFIQRSGLVYPMWNKKFHLVQPFDIPGNWKRIVTIDPAATGVTAAMWVAVDPRGNLFGYREYYEREKTVSEHAKCIQMLCEGEPIDIWLLDPTWGRQRNAENHKQNMALYREAGIPVRLPEVGKDFGLNVSREYLQAATVKNSREPSAKFFSGQTENFEHEISRYSYAQFMRGEQRGQSKETPRKGNDHLINAFQYLCATRPKGLGYTPSGSSVPSARLAELNSYT